jgi:hypothetical protein
MPLPSRKTWVTAGAAAQVFLHFIILVQLSLLVKNTLLLTSQEIKYKLYYLPAFSSPLLAY